MADGPNIQVPGWLIARLNSAGGNFAPRYEASMYGPVNGFLACYFPVHRRYLIKPQGKIRPAVWTELGGDDAVLRISLDSYSGEVLSRDEKGSEDTVKIPDFITVKASASLHQDRVVLLVEVKRNDETILAAQEQLGEYFEAFMDKTRADGTPLVTHLNGLLVAGNQAVMASWTSGGEIQWSELVDMTGVEVDNFLKQITNANWYLL